LVLSANNVYNGPTVVSNGVLAINGTNSLTGTSGGTNYSGGGYLHGLRRHIGRYGIGSRAGDGQKRRNHCGPATASGH